METIENIKFIITLVSEGLIRVEIKNDVLIEKEDLIDNHKIFTKMLKGKQGLFLIVFRRGANATDDAKSEYANLERSKLKIADAIVVESTLLRIGAQFVFKFFKPEHQKKIFSNEQEGLKWLATFKS
ncbi:MAG: hypothetical protein HRT72_09985 [Flavobacteriales bacterium]|nr:hypothetical protein [Flavobacteriales bacterium]